MRFIEFENKWVQKIKNDLLKSFPDDFLESDNYELLNLPGKPLLKGSELFGSFEIIDTDGVTLLSTDNLDKLKYILYANKNNPSEIKLSTNEEELSKSVKNYEKHIDEVIKMIEKDFVNEFPTSDRFTSVSSKIFQLLNLRRY